MNERQHKTLSEKGKQTRFLPKIIKAVVSSRCGRKPDRFFSTQVVSK
jgi:hypothetical protein